MKNKGKGIKEEAILTGVFTTLRLVKHTIDEVFKDNHNEITSAADYIDKAITELMRDGKPDVDPSSKLNIGSVMPRFYSPDEKPRVSEDDETFSVDVFIIDENGMHGIACWSYEADYPHWVFHTDTLVDYFEKGNETKWKWYYPPYEKDKVVF